VMVLPVRVLTKICMMKTTVSSSLFDGTRSKSS
jgi:hypothetical protein